VKTPAITFLFSTLAVAGMALGDVPKKPPLNSYSKLWTDSPFTTKPPPPEVAGPENPLSDYGLIGVSPIGGDNYRVTILNKKSPDEPRIYLETGREVAGFKLLKVNRKHGDPLATTVQVQTGSSTGTISVDEKLLTLATPPPPKVAAPAPGGQNGAPPVPGQPPQPGANNAPQPGNGRTPRPRVVPPPTAGGGQQQVAPPTQNRQPQGVQSGGNSGRQSMQRSSRR
jgi:hypothetical protein